MKTEFITVYILLLVISIVIYTIIETKVKDAKTSKKKNLLYCLGFGLSFGIITLIYFLGLKNLSLYYFILIQILVLAIGIVHARLLFKILPWTSPKSFGWELLYSSMIACIGAIFMLFTLSTLRLSEHEYLMMSSISWFFVPILFIMAINQYSSSPKADLKKWVYPLHQPIAPPSQNEMNSPVVISFEFQKGEKDSGNTIFRAKAPRPMPLGKLFYYFINDYNERHPETPIDVAADENKPYGWLFYYKPQWYRKTIPLDYEASIRDNQIKENSVIICMRVN